MGHPAFFFAKSGNCRFPAKTRLLLSISFLTFQDGGIHIRESIHIPERKDEEGKVCINNVS